MNDELKDLRILADAMDNHFRGPFGWRFGWDGLLGLIPVVGDTVTSAISAYIIFRAAQLGGPPSVLVRMGFNVVVENLVDFIPMLGNLFDFVWKANVKNIRLLEVYLANPSRVRRHSRGLIFLTFVLVLAAMVATIVFAVYTLKLVLSALLNMF
jgi:hypothetical protein